METTMVVFDALADRPESQRLIAYFVCLLALAEATHWAAVAAA